MVALHLLKYRKDLLKKHQQVLQFYPISELLLFCTSLWKIVEDAYLVYNWSNFSNVFEKIKIEAMPPEKVDPFSIEEWNKIMAKMNPWYIPYFKFAVSTGLRPSEQVALKWSAIKDDSIDIDNSRVRNEEKNEMKTMSSYRFIPLTGEIRQILNEQKELSAKYNSEYVFVNLYGRPILQDKLRELWHRVLKKTDVRYRKMYCTRHTFATWAIKAGEPIDYIAKIMGRADTSMIHKRYTKYIKNLTRKDGSLFEKFYSENVSKKDEKDDKGTI